MKERVRQEYLDLYESEADRLYRYIVLRVFSQTRGQDLLQDAFLKTWDYAAQGKKIDNMKALLYRIATNLIIDERRKKRPVSLEQVLEQHPQREPASDGQAQAEHDMLVHEIREALEAIPEKHRLILLLRYIEELSPPEIADRLGISVTATSVRLHRATGVARKLFPPDLHAAIPQSTISV